MPGDQGELETQIEAMEALLDRMRFLYFDGVLASAFGSEPADRTVLDVGCGGGSLSHHFARAGYKVTGVDPDPGALRLAVARGATSSIDVKYERASAESLPFPAAMFDVVVCSEVLEHVADVGQALDEIERVLKPGGLFLFSTPNRTPWTKLLLIKIAQEWRLTRVITAVHHEFDRLIRPAELAGHLGARGIAARSIDGVSISGKAIPRAIVAYVRFKLERASLSAVAASLDLRSGGPRTLAYIGWGVKDGRDGASPKSHQPL